MPPPFDPRDYLQPTIVPVKDDIFRFTPENCDACALWLRTAFNRLFAGWSEFARQLEAHRLFLLKADEWQLIAPQRHDRLWNNPLGSIVWIKPALTKLRYIYFFPNLENASVDEPAQARLMVLCALERLNELGVKVVSMNGIHGADERIEDGIKDVMVRAVEEWLGRKGAVQCSIDRIYLVDRAGAFGDERPG